MHILLVITIVDEKSIKNDFETVEVKANPRWVPRSANAGKSNHDFHCIHHARSEGGEEVVLRGSICCEEGGYAANFFFQRNFTLFIASNTPQSGTRKVILVTM